MPSITGRRCGGFTFPAPSDRRAAHDASLGELQRGQRGQMVPGAEGLEGEDERSTWRLGPVAPPLVLDADGRAARDQRFTGVLVAGVSGVIRGGRLRAALDGTDLGVPADVCLPSDGSGFRIAFDLSESDVARDVLAGATTKSDILRRARHGGGSPPDLVLDALAEIARQPDSPRTCDRISHAYELAAVPALLE